MWYKINPLRKPVMDVDVRDTGVFPMNRRLPATSVLLVASLICCGCNQDPTAEVLWDRVVEQLAVARATA